MDQEELIKSIESAPQPTPSAAPPQPMQKPQPQQQVQPLPEESNIAPKKKKRSFFDILTIISYFMLAIAFGIIGVGILLGNFL